MEQEAFLALKDSTTDNLYPALFQCFTIILCGYIAGRVNIVSGSESKGIATFVGTFALPSLIFLSLARLDFSAVNWAFLLAILLAKGIVFFSVIIVTLFVSKPVNLGRAGIFAIFCTQSNDFALGYPIINAIYDRTHPDYALYLYLMAPISLAILNPIAFVLMEINKQKESNQAVTTSDRSSGFCKVKLLKEIATGIAFNPVLVMTVLGIIGNIVFKHQLSIYIEGLLEVFGQSFSASALFLLGLRMVGQIHRLKGPALVTPCVLIMVKLIVLPVVMRESVSALHAGVNETDTLSLSTYAFLYGTIPTAPAVFVFSNLYQLELDLIASSMVICTFLSGPMMFLSAQVIAINKDYREQLAQFGFDLSIVALVASLYLLLIFIVTNKYKRMPHRLTMCLMVTQLLLSASIVCEGPRPAIVFSWLGTAVSALRIFSMYSCLLWTSMLSIGLLMLQSRGPCLVVTLWPVLGFVAWGAPAAMVTALLLTKGEGDIDRKAADAIRLCLLVFCITVTTGCLIVYMRFRRRSAQLTSTSGEDSAVEESTCLVDNAEPHSTTPSTNSLNGGCYGTITTTPSPNIQTSGCCSNDPNCDTGLADTHDIEDIADNAKQCACPSSQKSRCAAGSCEYLQALERAAGQLGLLPPEQSCGRGLQLLKHTALIIVYSLFMFIGITYTSWRSMSPEESGVFIMIQFLDIAANYGQSLVMFILFGLDPDEIAIPLVRYFKRKWHGAHTLVLPPIEDLSFETKHVCDQFITHHLERCKEAIARDTRWRMRTYKGVFRGSCLVRWLRGCGLARDDREAESYGRHLLEGRLIAHINHQHHFTNSPLLYTFNSTTP